MKRLKELRLARGLTQRELADRLGTTQQSVGRWETGKSAPSISMLNALARVLESTVGHLLGQRAATDGSVGSASGLESEESRFWGHIGLLLPAISKTLWFLISASTRSRVWSVLRNLDIDDDGNEWLIVETMNNRILALMPDRLDRIWLLDDACDGPEGDWSQKFPLDDYAGLPSELYRDMDRWLDNAWGVSDSELSEELNSVSERIVRANLDDPEKLNEFLHYTSLYYINGRKIDHHFDPDDLWVTITELESGFNRTIYLPGFCGKDETFVPLGNLCLLNAPLIDALEGQGKELAELE